MTDPELVEKKLAFIESCLADLRRSPPTLALRTDLREQRFVLYTLQIAIQAALDAASHIVSDERLGEPATNADLFLFLVRAAIIDAALASKLARMVGLRNVIVHAYVDVDLAVVESVLRDNLGDLETFVAAVRSYLGRA